MALIILLGFIVIPLIPLVHHRIGDRIGWVMPLLPLGLTLYFASYLGQISHADKILLANYEWVPSLGVNLSFRMDGLSLIFAMTISGIGTLVFLYAGEYLKGDLNLGKFYAYLTFFMASMLGLVLANDILLLFVFWELTSIASYLLISYYHSEEASREAGKTALIVTGSGGLAMLAGLILLSMVTQTSTLSKMFDQTAVIQSHHLYAAILVLISLGAFAKSAQFPFHFWLPGAMEAPAPVSAYLHSATMVKAGIYLLARLNPILGGTAEWHWLITSVGGITMLLGGYLAWQQTDLKRILAYTTISALGIITFLLGIGTKETIKAALLFFIVHALYKAALFMVGGTIDHETGTRDIRRLGGLRTAMPITALGATLSALSMAGIPPLLGFFGKEVIYEGTQHADWAGLLTFVALLGNLLNVTAAGMVAIRPFYGELKATPHAAHEAPWMMWLGPAVLGIASLSLGIFASAVLPLLQQGIEAVYGHEVGELHLGYAVNLSLLLSLITLAGGIILYYGLEKLRPLAAPYDLGQRLGPAKSYHALMNGILKVADWEGRLIRQAHMRYYLHMIMGTLVIAIGYVLISQSRLVNDFEVGEIRFYEIVLAFIIMAAAVAVTLAQSRLAAVTALGVVGFGVAIIFVLFGAPDLAMTQFSIEVLSVILFILVLYRLPKFRAWEQRPSAAIRDAIFASGVGLVMTVIVLVVISAPLNSRLTPYFAQASYAEAQGRNVVNVILVDFRGFDTMGEITVLAIAAIGVFGLLQLHEGKPLQRKIYKGFPSLILRTAIRYVVPILLLFSIFLLLRGHQEPGGGFVGGLVAAAAFALYGIAYDVATARQALRLRPILFIASGLALAVASGLYSILNNKTYMTSLWYDRDLPALGHVGTPFFFDVGVYLVVLGVMLLIIFNLAEQEETV